MCDGFHPVLIMKHLRTALIGEPPHAPCNLFLIPWCPEPSHYVRTMTDITYLLTDLIIHIVIKSGSCFPNLYGKVFMTIFYYYLLSPHLSVVPTVLISYMHVPIVFMVCAVLSRVAVAWQAPTLVELFRREASSGPAGWMRTQSTPQTRPSRSSSARSAASVHTFTPQQQTLRVH